MTYNPPSDVMIYDTTLRDGEQTPGVTITTDEKIVVAEKLDKLGVDVIELGFPAASPGEQRTFKEAAKLGFDAQISGLARALTVDIDKAIDSDAEYIHTFIGTSPLHREYKLKMSKEAILEKAVSAVDYIKDHGFELNRVNFTNDTWKTLKSEVEKFILANPYPDVIKKLVDGYEEGMLLTPSLYFVENGEVKDMLVGSEITEIELDEMIVKYKLDEVK